MILYMMALAALILLILLYRYLPNKKSLPASVSRLQPPD